MTPDYFSVRCDRCLAVNDDIRHFVYAHGESEAVMRSHFIGDRYENIYIPAERVPGIETVLYAATDLATGLLNCEADKLQIGFWFNHMQPGHSTSRHNHDEYDELLSAVYYVDVPQRSGDLLLYTGDVPTRITPEAGMFIFFPPNMDHEVDKNRSQASRLSIGMNFGFRADDTAE